VAVQLNIAVLSLTRDGLKGSVQEYLHEQGSVAEPASLTCLFVVVIAASPIPLAIDLKFL
jgi:hypothetical protein